jgi:hypothetical protein
MPTVGRLGAVERKSQEELQMIPKESNEPFWHLRVELRRLKRIHDVTIYSYQQTHDYVQTKLRSKDILSNTPITVQIAEEECILARSPHELIARLTSTYPKILRESLFVRAVSQFETFLVDTVWEIAERSIDPFKRQDKQIEYPQAELLSFTDVTQIHRDIIGKECRQLTGQGFNYARRYYETRFNIRFADAPIPLRKIKEIHERRHLLVHRGGVVDDKYQQRFAPSLQIGDRIAISELYFHEALDGLLQLGTFIAQKVEVNWPRVQLLNKRLAEHWKAYIMHSQTQMVTDETLAYWFKAKFKNKTELEVHLCPEFAFNVDDEKHYLSEILIASELTSDCVAEWIVDGPKKVTGPYIGYQKMMAERGRFVDFQCQRLISVRNTRHATR